jgi:hypothetical protein
MAFVKGKSGNPSGRPKEIGHVRDLARAHTDAAILTLASIHADMTQPAPARVAAAQALLDRAWGKPAQSIGGDPDGVPIKMVVAWEGEDEK